LRPAGRRQVLKAKRSLARQKPVRVTRTPQNNRHSFDLVIFDCDGVLVDSEVISCRAHAEALTRHGYPITEQQVLERFLGVSDREARLIVEAELGRRLPDDFEAQMKQAALQHYPHALGGIPHIGEAIAAIGLPKCVASSGTLEKIRHGLTCAGLYDALAPHIFSATQVKRGKPAPDLFLFAAGQMDASPERCVVIEDSIPGITGALDAGMAVLGFHGGSHCLPGHGDKLRTAGATATFDDMRQLPGLIGEVANSE
jgi:beta-phosphoglucomutase-like phosphatase (HAD superfamily)